MGGGKRSLSKRTNLGVMEKLQVVGVRRSKRGPWDNSTPTLTLWLFAGSTGMKEGMSNNSTTSISQARKAVEQLKMEACMDRVKVNSLSLFLPVPEWPCEAQFPNRGTVSGCVLVPWL